MSEKKVSSTVVKVQKVQGVIAGLLTVKEMSLTLGGEKTGWTGKKIRRLIRRGKVNAVKNIGRWYFNDEHKEELIALATDKAG